MTMKILLSGIHTPLLILFLLTSGCGNSPLSSSGVEFPPDTFIDEPIVIDLSEEIHPANFDEEDSVFVFDLNDVALVTGGRCDDCYLTYWTPTGCDEDTWIFNAKHQTWEQIGFHPEGPIFCTLVGTEQQHFFSARRIDPGSCVDNDGIMKIRGDDVCALSLRALDLHPDYSVISLNIPDPDGLGGITFDGVSLWVMSGSYGAIFRLPFVLHPAMKEHRSISIRSSSAKNSADT